MKLMKIAVLHLLLFELLSTGIGATRARVHLYSKDRNLILKLHNDFRRSVGATNMMELAWDHEAAKAAADWSGKCLYKERPDNEWGQNMNQFSDVATESFSPVKIFRDSFKEWSKEGKLYDHNNNDFRNCDTKHKCSYVQLLTAEVKGVGCALMKCPDLNMTNGTIHNAQLFVCVYTPRVNILGQAPYLEGRPCSACRAGTKCINKLCAEGKDRNESLHISLEAPQIRVSVDSDGRLETEGQQANVALPDGNKETDRNRQDSVPYYANVVIPFPGPEERRDVRLLARMERRHNVEHFQQPHNNHQWKKTSGKKSLSELTGKSSVDKANSPIRRKRQTDEYIRRRNERYQEQLRRQQTLQALRDREDQERDEARRREYERRLQLYLREKEIREQQIREQQERDERRLSRERLRNIIERTDGLNDQEQYFTIAAHNVYRRQERLKELTWSNRLERWAKYVIRCDREYPGPITCYTNFGKNRKERDIYNVVYDWASEGPFRNNIRLETGCRTPADKTVCNHNTVIQNPDISEMACASMDCGTTRQLTCIYH